MFASVRRYAIKPGDLAEVERRLPGAVEAISTLTGFRAYYFVKGKDGTVAAVSLFSSEEAALKSNEVAAAFIMAHAADVMGEPSDTVTGEVIAYA